MYSVLCEVCLLFLKFNCCSCGFKARWGDRMRFIDDDCSRVVFDVCMIVLVLVMFVILVSLMCYILMLLLMV